MKAGARGDPRETECERPTRHRGIATISIICAGVFACSCGCRTPVFQHAQHITQERRDSAYAKAEARFENATLFKPRDELSAPVGPELCPLIVEQQYCSAYDAPRHCGFGSVMVSPNGTPTIDSSFPAVYVNPCTVRLNAIEYSQLEYVWARESHDAKSRIVWRGIRTTFDSEGFPLAWEILDSGHELKLIFVSISLELAAVDRVGGPLPGRRFASETSITMAPDFVVAGTVEDGPIPLGPYVYISARPSVITALLCRCSPSGVDRFIDSRYYDVRPTEELEVLGFELPPWPDTLGQGVRWPYEP